MAKLNYSHSKPTKSVPGGWECCNCGQFTSRLISCKEEGGYVGCPRCISYTRRRGTSLGEGLGPDLHTVVDKAGTTVGKSWEIAHRRFAEDGVTVINHVTGKEAQY